MSRLEGLVVVSSRPSVVLLCCSHQANGLPKGSKVKEKMAIKAQGEPYRGEERNRVTGVRRRRAGLVEVARREGIA